MVGASLKQTSLGGSDAAHVGAALQPPEQSAALGRGSAALRGAALRGAREPCEAAMGPQQFDHCLWQCQAMAPLPAVALRPSVNGTDGSADEGCRSAAIAACAKGMHWEKALLVFSGSPEVSTVSYNATISACSRCTQWPAALQLFEEAQATGKADRLTFNATMASCGKGQYLGVEPLPGGDVLQQWRLASHLFAEMPKHSWAPDKVSYGSLVVACEKASEWSKALELFGQMKKSHVDSISCATLISACERGRRWEEALDFLQIMLRDSMRPTEVVHGVVIGACIKSHQLKEGLSLYNSMLEGAVTPHEITSSSLVVALSGQWQWQEALRLALQSETLTPAALIASVTAAEILSQWQDGIWLLDRCRSLASPPLLALTAAASCAAQTHSDKLLKEATVAAQLRSSEVLVEHNAAITAAERSRNC
eukprot:s25_g10.t1